MEEDEEEQQEDQDPPGPHGACPALALPQPRAAFPPRHLNAKEMRLQGSTLMVLMRERG